MKNIFKTVLILGFFTSTLFSQTQNNINRSVVKIFSTVSTANYRYPWQSSNIVRYVGSGAIISNNRILTSAHVVSGAKLLEITKENDPKKYIAAIKYISHQADLALLEIEDKSFFTNTKNFTLSTNANLRDEVTVVGYPKGGENVSVTIGVISRIEQQYYTYSAENLFAIQVDAAINSGNSGGPVLNNKNELIGIAMMKRSDAENIAYIIPTEIINTFLEDTKDGKVDGFHKERSFFVPTENNTLKEYYGLKNGNGVLLALIDKYNDILEINDIILAIDGKEIASNGTISTQYGRIAFEHIYNTKQIGDSVTLDVLRDKKYTKVKCTVKKMPELVEFEYAKNPRYVIYGGLAFVPITKNYLATLSKLEAEIINQKLYSKKKSEEYQEAITMMSTIFPNEVNRGYSSWASVLKSVNGIPIKNFKHLLSVLDGIDEQYTKFEFLEQSILILDTKKAKESFKDIQQAYSLTSDRRL